MLAAAIAPGTARSAPTTELQFLGQQIIPTATQFQGTPFGGLSGMAYDERRNVFYAFSDDQANVRFYTLRIGVATGVPAVQILAVTTLRDASGQPFATATVDPEGLALTKDDTLVLTSEGFANRLIDPWVREFSLDGRQLRSLPVPSAFLPNVGGTRGVRQNLGFESAATAPNGRFLFTGTEGALAQDGPPSTLTAGSPARLLRYNLQTGQLDRQYVYWTDPIAEPPVPATQFAVSGLVELLPLNNQFLLSMERSFSVGAPGTGNKIKLYSVALPGADDVNGFDSLAPAARRDPAGREDPAAQPRRSRPAARQRGGDGLRPRPAGRPALAHPRQRQQLRSGSVHAVPALRCLAWLGTASKSP